MAPGWNSESGVESNGSGNANYINKSSRTSSIPRSRFSETNAMTLSQMPLYLSSRSSQSPPFGACRAHIASTAMNPEGHRDDASFGSNLLEGSYDGGLTSASSHLFEHQGGRCSGLRRNLSGGSALSARPSLSGASTAGWAAVAGCGDGDLEAGDCGGRESSGGGLWALQQNLHQHLHGSAPSMLHGRSASMLHGCAVNITPASSSGRLSLRSFSTTHITPSPSASKKHRPVGKWNSFEGPPLRVPCEVCA